MADERIEDISGGQLTTLAIGDRLVALDASDTTDDADGTAKWMYARTIASIFQAGLIDGLITSNNGTDAAHDIDIGAGVCTVTDGTNWTLAQLTSSITKQIDASWASGTNAGGLDGTESVAGTPDADTWYHIFIVFNPTTNATDVVFSESATTPTVPTGYTYYRRIGAVLTDGSANIIGYTQHGDEFIWDARTSDVTAANPGTSASLRTVSVPSGIVVEAMLQASTFDNSYGAATYTLISSPNSTDAAAGINNSSYVNAIAAVTTLGMMVELQCFTNTSSQVRSRLSASNADITLRLGTIGWLDPRGRSA